MMEETHGGYEHAYHDISIYRSVLLSIDLSTSIFLTLSIVLSITIYIYIYIYRRAGETIWAAFVSQVGDHGGLTNKTHTCASQITTTMSLKLYIYIYKIYIYRNEHRYSLLFLFATKHDETRCIYRYIDVAP